MKIDELNIIPGNNIKDFEKLLVCHGGLLADQSPEASKTLCTVSSIGLLQHKECETIIKSKSKCCKKCKSLKHILKLKSKRKASDSNQNLEVTHNKIKKLDDTKKSSNNY